MLNEFNEETCTRCGICLEQCPYMNLPKEKAKEEISLMIDTRTSERIIKNCLSCSYCNVICPTQSNPRALRHEIRSRHSHEMGVSNMRLITEEVPHNFMSISFEFGSVEKGKDMEKYSNPQKSKEMFYLGCGIPYIFPNLPKSKLLEGLPLMGGMKYCCASYAHRFFGEKEAKIKGLELFDNFKTLGIEKLISFCPGCENMLKAVYPSIVEGFTIECQNIIDYLIEKYHEGELNFKNKINQRITFQDPCSWRNHDKKIYEGPRELLEIMGAEVVEMKHNKEKSLCCGSPADTSNRSLGMKIARNRIKEARDVEVDSIAFLCSGCIFQLSKHAASKNIESYYITELAQIAIGESPFHKIVETSKQTEKYIYKKVVDNPNLVRERYVMKNGKTKRI